MNANDEKLNGALLYATGHNHSTESIQRSVYFAVVFCALATAREVVVRAVSFTLKAKPQRTAKENWTLPVRTRQCC